MHKRKSGAVKDSLFKTSPAYEALVVSIGNTRISFHRRLIYELTNKLIIVDDFFITREP